MVADEDEARLAAERVLREAGAIADALTGLEVAYAMAGRRRARRRRSARTTGRLVRMLRPSEGEYPGGPLLAGAVGARISRNRGEVGRLSRELDEAMRRVLEVFRTACPPGPEETVATHAALDALATDTHGTSRWEAVFDALEERLALLEEEHRNLGPRALLDQDGAEE